MDKLVKAFNYIFIKLFSLIPVKKDYIVFFSVPDYSDNAWAIYDYIRRRHPGKYRLIWLVKNKPDIDEEGTVFVDNNPKLFWLKRDYYLAVSKFVIITHSAPLRTWRKSQVFIHTKHSASQLKSAVGAGEGKKRKDADVQLICGQDGWDRNLTGHGYDEETMIRIGMPRLDLLYRHKDCVSKLFPSNHFSKAIIAMETFKQSKKWNDSTDSISYGLNMISSEEELKRFDDFLVEKEVLLIIKPHPLQVLDHIKIGELKNIRFITDQTLSENGIQLYELLENMDALITDYSSVYYDYLLLNRPIGFTLGDMETYKRGFIIDNPLDEMTGEKIKNYDELETFINHLLSGQDDYESERTELIKRVFDHTDNKNCKRLYRFMRESGLRTRKIDA